MMATGSIPFSGRERLIDRDPKASSCQTSTESKEKNHYYLMMNISFEHLIFLRTNVLERYFNKEFTIKLPDNKRITEVKWLAIYDLQSQNTFGDVYIPEEFDPPSPQRAGSFSKISHNVSSGSIEILDSKTIRIPNFSYDGLGRSVQFWAGVGAQPANKGFKVPDELG
jgi:hypothetical protein